MPFVINHVKNVLEHQVRGDGTKSFATKLSEGVLYWITKVMNEYFGVKIPYSMNNPNNHDAYIP